MLAPTSLSIDTTATGSVALTTAPKSKAIDQLHLFSPIPAIFIPITIKAVSTIATMIPGTARINAFADVFLNV